MNLQGTSKFVENDTPILEAYRGPQASHEEITWTRCAEMVERLVRFIKFTRRRLNRGITHYRHPKRKARRVNGRLRHR